MGADDRHGWGPLLDELARRRAAAAAMGGEEKLRNALLRALALTASREAGPFAPVLRFGALP